MGKHNWIVGVTALAVIGGLGGCSRISPQELAAARQAGAAEASRSAAEEKAKADKARLEKDVADLKKKAAEASARATKAPTSSPSGGGSSGGSVGTRNCGGNVTANSATSCSFALTVAGDWQNSGGGNASFWSYSTVTNKSYWMRCSAGVVTVCRGGNGAAVYIR